MQQLQNARKCIRIDSMRSRIAPMLEISWTQFHSLCFHWVIVKFCSCTVKQLTILAETGDARCWRNSPFVEEWTDDILCWETSAEVWRRIHTRNIARPFLTQMSPALPSSSSTLHFAHWSYWPLRRRSSPTNSFSASHSLATVISHSSFKTGTTEQAIWMSILYFWKCKLLISHLCTLGSH